MSPKKKKSATKQRVQRNHALLKQLLLIKHWQEKKHRRKKQMMRLHISVLFTCQMFLQFIDEDSECNSPVSIEPSPSAPPESTFAVIHSPKKSAVSTSEPGVPTTQHFQARPAFRPVPSISSITVNCFNWYL